MKKYISSMAALLLSAAALALVVAQNWQPTDKYNITFSTDGVSGIFKTFKGTLAFDEKNLDASRFDVAIDVASINTGNGLQNKHAKSDEWFDAAKFPQIKYTSKKIMKVAAGYQATGDLEIHGVKKEVAILFTFQNKGASGVFTGTFNVNRNDFHIGTPGGEVGAVIKLNVTMPVIKK